MNAPRELRAAIYGTGRVAGALARALGAVPGVVVAGLGGRDAERTAGASAAAGVPALPVGELLTASDLLIVAVADGAILAVAERLAAGAKADGLASDATAAQPAADGAAEGPTSRAPAAGLSDGAPARWAVHCSGALGSDALEPLRRAGLGVGAWHPLQAFPTPDTTPGAGVTWTHSTEDAELAAILERLTLALGGRPHALGAAYRPAYHAAAVLAANYPATLVAHAAGVLTDCGFAPDEALAALLPLARSALDALESAGIPGGLTGPAVRGDVATITSHLAALDARPATRELYRAAGLGILPLAQARGLDQEGMKRLRAALMHGQNLS